MSDAPGSTARTPVTFIQRLEQSKDAAAVLGGACFMAVMLRWFLDWVSLLHWSLGAIAALAVVAIALAAMGYVKRTAHEDDPVGALAMLSLGLLSIVVVGGWVSFTLHSLRAATYEVPAVISAGTFTDLYLYTFLDLVPGVRVLETLNLAPPVRPIDVRAGLPVLAFKVFVIVLFYDTIRSWWKHSMTQARAAERPTAGKPVAT